MQFNKLNFEQTYIEFRNWLNLVHKNKTLKKINK